MIVILASVADVIDSLHALLRQQRLSEVLLLLDDLESLNKGVLEEARPLEAICGRWHENASDCDHVTRRALSSDLSLGDDLDHSGHVTDWHLVTRLLNLDVLVGQETGGLHLEDKLSIHLVCLALV